MDIKVNMKSKKRISLIISVTLAMTLIFTVVAPVIAVSRTGLESSLDKEWDSDVDRAQCPDFLYPSHNPSIVTGEKVYKANCAR